MCMTNKELVLDCLVDGDEEFVQIVEFFKFAEVDISIEELKRLLEEMLQEGYLSVCCWKNEYYPYSLTQKGWRAWREARKMFYYDDIIKLYEQRLNYDAVLEYLEKIVWTHPDKIIPTIIGYAWYFCTEGNVNIHPKRYNFQTYLQTWKRYIDIGVEKCIRNPRYDFIAGYTLSLHGIYLDSFYGTEYEKMGNAFMEKCYERSNEEIFVELARNFLLNEKSKKYIYLENAKKICEELFSSNSLLDNYFLEIYRIKD